MSISIRGIAKQFGQYPALHAIDLEIEDGELISLLGPSGSGKTTLLRILAGLEIPDSGAIYLDGTDVTDHKPASRRVGLVFQHYALWGHMPVFENIAFGLKVGARKGQLSKAEMRQRVMKLIDVVQLTGMDKRLPSQLSGGQQQRVGLARALAIEPRVLLLDEPFGALDAKVRKELRGWVRELQKELGITTVFVTHDQEEAMEMSDRVVVMNVGKIEQIGTPAEIYRAPVSAFVCEFIGSANKLPVTVRNGVAYLGNVAVYEAPGQSDGPAVLFVRPNDWLLNKGEGGFSVEVLEEADLGAIQRAKVLERLSGTRLELMSMEDFPLERPWKIRPAKAHLFSTAESGD